jgi:glycosyltransferase involved in cell wall biosynthesis
MGSVSVLLCACRESFEDFEAAVRSVVLQSLRPSQLIVVDDSGEGRFALHCQDLEETLLANLGIDLTYIENEQNLGLVDSLNLGLGKVRGDYVARMDADDLSLPYRFQMQVSLLESGFDIVGGAVELFNADGYLKRVCYPTTRFRVLYSLLFNNPIAHPVCMFRTDVVRSLNGYRNVSHAEDLDLWMRAYLEGRRISSCRPTLLLRRIHANQVSVEFRREQQANAQSLRHWFRRKILIGSGSWLSRGRS